MSLLFGIVSLAGALVLFAALGVMLAAEPLAIPLLFAVLAFAWWLSGKQWRT